MLLDTWKRFQNPGPEFRGAPFWAWNSELDPEEIRRQIRIFHQMGLGGFFMHSRVGLNTPYLGKQFFDCIRAAADEAEKFGMHAWLYDEDRWPSGAAGGKVTANPAFRLRVLCFDETLPEKDAEDEVTLGIFFVKLDQEQFLHSFRKAAPGEENSPPPAGEKRIRFFRKLAPPSPWFNNQTYLDTMNPEAVGEFIRITHEAYRREAGQFFNRSIPGIFTDEPCYIYLGSIPNSLPWTDRLPEKFREKFGYDILERLPELFFREKDEDFSRTRLNYRDLCTELFVSAFAKQIGKWCGENELLFTGHVLGENSVVTQSYVVGSAMRFYEYMQAPGIDVLSEHWFVFDTAKQCSSMARQFGRKWRLTETYGCTGWDFPLAGHKALADWQFALGINLRCQHLAWYSMEGQAKRDYPASISEQSPWFREYPVVEDYCARIGAALSEGEEQRRLLLIHPIESTWGIHACFSPPESLEEEAAKLPAVSGKILGENIDFDYGDEEVMSRHAVLSKEGEDPVIRIGKGVYHAVLLPQMRTIRKSTLSLLRDFRKAGGSVFFLTGGAPEFLDGFPSPETSRICQEEFLSVDPEKDLAEKLGATARIVSVTEGDSGREIVQVLHLLKRAEGFHVLFLCNLGMNPADAPEDINIPQRVLERKDVFRDVRISVKGIPPEERFVYEADPAGGDVSRLTSAVLKDGVLRFRTSLEQLGSRLFFITSEELPCAGEISSDGKEGLPGKREDKETGNAHRRLLLPSSGWSFRRDEPNVLVLDRPVCSIGEEKAMEECFVLTLDARLRTRLGVPPRGGGMAQPYLKRQDLPPRETLSLRLDYSLNCGKIPETDCFLAMERPELYQVITFNGTSLDRRDSGRSWCDRSLHLLKIPASAFRKGKNALSLECGYHEQHPGLEALFLLGDFGVSDETITELPDTLSCGDLCSQGLPCYSGNLTYVLEMDLPEKTSPRFLLLEEPACTAAALSVNGSPRRTLGWPPYRFELAEWIHPGCNRFEITLLGSRRNSHGPFYMDQKWPRYTGAAELEAEMRREKNLVPFGLLHPPVLEF